MTSDSDRNIFSLISPGARAAFIVGGFFLGLFTLATFWISNEARRIKLQREQTAAVNTQQGETGEMIAIPAGSFTMGGVGPYARPDELPLHDVKISSFWMDRTEVTNEEFARFTNATGYITVAERSATLRRLPAGHSELAGNAFSLCFARPAAGEALGGMEGRWEYRVGASWRHPRGPGSDIAGKEKHPVTHVCLEDAEAYCRWAGKRLPTEAEWEYAARGGIVSQEYVWGREAAPGGKPPANVFDGREVGGTQPVGQYPANGFGLVDMAGNVWQLTADWYQANYYSTYNASNSDRQYRRNPPGPETGEDPAEPGVWKKVARGGSFLSGDWDGRSYRPSARLKVAVDLSREDLGFRCAKDGAGR